MRAYVTVVGTSPEAVFNPLWYLVEVHGWVPEEVYLIWNDGVKNELDRVRELIERLSRAYGMEIRIHSDESLKVEEAKPDELRDRVFSLLERLAGKEVVVDIIPGRKFMSAVLFGAAASSNAEITYLHLSDWRDYVGKLLFEVPMSKQRLFTGRELLGRPSHIQRWRRRESPGSFTVTREELMAILDSLYIDGTTEFGVSLRSLPIGSASLGERASFHLEDFVKIPEEHGGHGMVKEALIAGGMVSFKNWNELVKKVFALLESGRPLYIGFDTNALLMRIPSRVLEEKAFYRGGSLIFDFVYSDEVALELGRMVNKKLPYKSSLGIYSNAPTPKARLASLGQVELEKLRSRGAERTSSGKDHSGDTKIALDYKAFAEEKDANVMVITFDDRAYAEMKALRGSGLVPFRLEWEFSFGRTFEGSWEALRDTLYVLAATLGELNFASYKLYGVWHGKNSEDWEREKIRLVGFEYGRIFRVLSEG
ncbi:hypothetical protein ADU37_CDS18240 [Thermococcus sp. 2319x1]|uniref:hypothetical protein n=1 Tax=Thermococcus sp. 2319x1 TaxID=1674923 RepID=UPI00073A5465|nr:hypothetical protein [Thermococcus sp. 2319x1]ALV63523.1 hypothetical protein ADU37_CDS18240 [Thermococcus sp. 2319x1]